VKDFATRGKESKDEVQIYTFATRGKESKDEVQIYTWRDTTLRELTDLVSQANEMCSICPKDSCSITFHHFALLPLFYYHSLF